jgi:hypothetical protein
MNTIEPGARQQGGIVLSAAQIKARRQRNIAIGLSVTALCVLFYAVTIAKLGSAALGTH